MRAAIKSVVRAWVRPPLLRSALDRRPTLIVLGYHAVDDAPPEFLRRQGVVTSPATLRGHLHWIGGRYPFASLADGIERLRLGTLRTTSVAVTFDDGFRSAIDRGLPILREHRAPATLFVNYDAAVRGRLWHHALAWLESVGRAAPLAAVLRPAPGCPLVRHARLHADAAELAALASALEQVDLSDMPRLHLDVDALHAIEREADIEIGNHTRRHDRCSRLSPGAQRATLRDNHRALRGLCNYRPLFAAPFGAAGDWDHATVRAAAAIRHEFITAQGGVNPAGHVGVDIRRIPCDGVPPERLEGHILTHGLGMP